MCFSLFGIRFEVSYLFASIVVMFIAFDRTGLYIPLLFGIIIHEMAHLIFIYLFKSKVCSVKLILGAISIEHTDIISPIKKIISLLSGPLANLILAIAFAYIGNQRTCAVNIVLGAYNLIPIKGLDGGAILTELLGTLCSQKTVDKMIKVITFCVVLVLVLLCIYCFDGIARNISLIIFSIYIITPLIFKKTLKDNHF